MKPIDIILIYFLLGLPISIGCAWWDTTHKMIDTTRVINSGNNTSLSK